VFYQVTDLQIMHKKTLTSKYKDSIEKKNYVVASETS
jgi:hypothetical protein